MDRARLGARVRVRFRRKPVMGLVAEVSDRCTLSRVLDVEGFPDEGATLPADLLSLARWVAKYYGCAVGEACGDDPAGRADAGQGCAAADGAPREGRGDAAAKEADGLPTEKNAQARVLRVLVKEPGGLPVTDLLRRAKASHSPVRTLEKAGWVRLETVDAGADPLVEATKAPPASDPGRAADAVSRAGGRGRRGDRRRSSGAGSRRSCCSA